MMGEILAALYAYGACQKAKELEIFDLLSKLLFEPDSKNPKVLLELRKRLKELKPYPYYKLIAERNNIFDPLSEEVVRAYWIGNNLLEKFSAKENPHHNFCILKDAEISSKDFGWDIIIKNINLCRISWGRVVRVDDLIEVEASLLWRKNGKFFETNPLRIKIKKGFLKNIQKNDFISFHWMEAREIISEQQKDKLDQINKNLVVFLNQERVL
jgi:hypothetical protein